ncbi:hypothetical protein [Sphingobium sp. Leaf26]|uniref:hypothetical protein n=1 Tax=Sphingobium sp. Leaf26 TaxID=1735693 RepID=UPI0012E15D7E|nr:hypothetical protein [Sphingobium sp. Leaf26]
MTVAAVSLAMGMEDNRSSLIAHTICKGALGILIAELTVNRFQYALNGVDLILLDLAAEQYEIEEWKKIRNSQEDFVAENQPQKAGSAIINPPAGTLDLELHKRKLDLQVRLKSFP